MSRRLGYHDLSKWTSVGVFVSLALCLAPLAAAQTHGAPTSVTSTGFGGRAINGTPPSVTSLGRQGYTPGGVQAPARTGAQVGHHPHHHPVYGSVWAVPYYPYDPGYAGGDASGDYSADDQYNGGPTVFDARGPGNLVPPVPYQRGAFSGPPPGGMTNSEAADSGSSQPETILVFKDGRELEVENYAIVGQTLYDFSEGGRHKIALADLDLAATAKENDSHGNEFRLPSAAAAN